MAEIKGIEIFKKIKLLTKAKIKKWQKEAPKTVISAMKEQISKGVSPVLGGGKFAKYSVSYKKAIKKGYYSKYGKSITPVNMKLSGKMLKSLTSRKTKQGFTVYFTSKLAKIHSKDAKTIRKVIPLKGEKLKGSVTKKAKQMLKDLITKAVNKL